MTVTFKLTAPSDELDAAIEHAINTKTKPLGSLGQIESIAAQIAKVQQTLTPTLSGGSLVLFAGDHGAAAHGISAYPQLVTRQMVLNFLQGGAAANVFCNELGLDFKVVDTGVVGGPFDAHPTLVSNRLGEGTENYLETPAMDTATLDKALSDGRAIGADASGDAVAFGEMGIGNTSSAALLAHKLTGVDLKTLVGPGTGLDEAGVNNKLTLLSQAATRTGPTLDAHTALTEYGGFEIAMMCGAMLGAAEAGKVVLVDGFIATAAALCATRLQGAFAHYAIYCHRSAEPGHTAVLADLNVTPILDIGLRLGEGSGAALAWPLVRSAVAMLNNMASFDSAGVSGPA